MASIHLSCKTSRNLAHCARSRLSLVIEAESYTATDGTQKIGPKVRYINPTWGPFR